MPRDATIRTCCGRSTGVTATVKLSRIRARTLLKWHARWLDGNKFSSAHAFIKKVRAVFGFGLTILEDKHCARIRQVMSVLRFPGAPRRRQRITVEQAQALIKAAHKRGEHGIALAQAFQTECMLRQKDVIGERLPIDEEQEVPAYLVDGDEKWVRGLIWEEIDADLIVRHVTSKKAKLAVFDLKLAPMIMAEFKQSKRRPSSGPVIVDDISGLPFQAFDFRRRWRVCARAAGIPDEVFNMDSRAGAISEAFDAKANPDFIRTAAVHSELATTQGYNRGDELARSSAVQRARVRNRVTTSRARLQGRRPAASGRPSRVRAILARPKRRNQNA